MKQAASGNTVRVHYRGTLADGTEFDSSAGREPLEFDLGAGNVIPGFEAALLGMAEGEEKNVTLEPEDAYGPHQAELVHVIERSRIPAEISLEVGTALMTQDGAGNQHRLVVVELDEENATLDGNHPLAGHALTFELKLVEIVG